MSVIFRAFRAVDDQASCLKFIEGHRNVLEAYGITMITSNNAKWVTHENTYVIIAESSENNNALGGVRVQVADEAFLLPIVHAVGQVDAKIHEVINMHQGKKIAEACGLWNAKEIAGYGYSFFILRSAIALAHQLSVDSLFALAAPVTVDMCLNAGFKIETYLGNNGFFNYPKLDLVATAMVINDLDKMSLSTESDRTHIFEIMNNPDQVAVVDGPRGPVTIDYRLSLKNEK